MDLPQEAPAELGCRHEESERMPGKMCSEQDAPVCWMDYLPEMTLLDVTACCDSPLPGSVPATPATAGSVNRRFASLQLSQLSSPTNLSTTASILCPQNKTPYLLQSSMSSPKAESGTFHTKPSKQNSTKMSEMSSSDKENNPEVHSPKLSKHNLTTASTTPNAKMVELPDSIYDPERWLDSRFFPEITLLDVTRDSEPSPREELSSMGVMQDIPPEDTLKNNMPPSEFSGQIAAEPGRSDMIQSEELSSSLTGNVTHTTSSFSEQSDKSVRETVTHASLEGTQDISTGSVLENRSPSSELSGQNTVKIQTSAEETLDTHPVNVTRDISSSSNMSVQCTASQFSTSDMQCNTSSKNVSSEFHGEPGLTSNTVEANNEELLTSHDASKLPQPSLKTAGSENSMFTSLPPAQLNSSTDLNTATQNKILEIPSSNVNSPKTESDAKDRAISVSQNTTETSLVVNQNCSAVKASGSSDMRNASFDRHSLQKSTASTILGDAGAATICLQNNTFDAKPPSQQNGTITLSETSSSDSYRNTFDKPSPDATSSPIENKSNKELLNHNGTTDGTDPNAKVVDTPESTFEANPAVEVASGAARRETNDHSQSSLPLKDGIHDSLGHQSMDTESNKANTFNWDDTLDLKSASLITSTPMTNCKIFTINTQREEGKTMGAQKKLYGDGPSKPGGQVPSGFPSNVVCDRKTFLTQPAAKSLLPLSKTASQLLKHKPASALPRLPPSGLPMTRRRTQSEALSNSAASDAPQTTGISSSYKLRATTTGSKQPTSGLQRPQLSGIPSGIQRAATGVRLSSARSNTPAPSSTNKLRGPTATNTVTKTAQAKKHPITRGEALPIAKRKKMDPPSPFGSAEISTSSCDAVNGTKNLKQPTTRKRSLPAKTQRDGCANCVMLEQQLKMQSQEIRRLKEELLKKSTR